MANRTLRRYSREEDAYIMRSYMNKSLSEMAEHLGRTSGSLHGRMLLLGVSIPEEVKRKRLYETATTNGAKSRFKKGHVAHNLGKKMSPEQYEKVKRTMFKKGLRPHNTKEKGAISVRKDVKSGRTYQYIKVADGVWLLHHRVLWERVHGEIPKGYVVRFNDGNSMNCVIDNLSLVSTSENMNANSIQRYPEELKKAIRAVKKIEISIPVWCG